MTTPPVGIFSPSSNLIADAERYATNPATPETARHFILHMRDDIVRLNEQVHDNAVTALVSTRRECADQREEISKWLARKIEALAIDRPSVAFVLGKFSSEIQSSLSTDGFDFEADQKGEDDDEDYDDSYEDEYD